MVTSAPAAGTLPEGHAEASDHFTVRVIAAGGDGDARGELDRRDVNHVTDLERRASLAGQKFEVKMQMRRQKALSRGILFVRLGQLSLGVRMHGKESDIHLLNARRWYDEQPLPPSAAMRW